MLNNLIFFVFKFKFFQIFHGVLPLGVFRRGSALFGKRISHNNSVSSGVVLSAEPSRVLLIPYVSLLCDFQNSWIAVPKFLISYTILPCRWINYLVKIIVKCYFALTIPFFIFARCSAFAFACAIKGFSMSSSPPTM